MILRKALAAFFVFIFITGNAYAQPQPPKGIFILSSDANYAAQLKFPSFVSGYTLRLKWSDLEKSPGVYDFSRIEETIKYLQKSNLSLNLEIFSAFAPQYVIKNASATFPVKIGRINSQAPMPWDKNALASWEKLLQTLSQYQIYNSKSNTKIALRDHPTLVSVDAPIVGMQGLRDMTGSILRHKDYDRVKFIDSVVRSVAASRKAFPNDYGFIAFFRIDDGKNPALPLDQAVFDRLNKEFMQTGIGLGLMQELWSDEGPKREVLGVYLAKVKSPNAVMLQALTSWTQPFTNPTAVASGNPEIGFSNAYKNYGVRYYEVYYPDVINPKFTPIFTKWANIIK